jgi:archaellum component FlaC
MACSREWASRYTETMTIDERLEKLTERHEALTMNLELLRRDVQDLRLVTQQDGENIRALARIAEIRERRLTGIEGGE